MIDLNPLIIQIQLFSQNQLEANKLLTDQIQLLTQILSELKKEK